MNENVDQLSAEALVKLEQARVVETIRENQRYLNEENPEVIKELILENVKNGLMQGANIQPAVLQGINQWGDLKGNWVALGVVMPAFELFIAIFETMETFVKPEVYARVSGVFSEISSDVWGG